MANRAFGLALLCCIGRLRLSLQLVRILRVEEDLYVPVFYRCRRNFRQACHLYLAVVGNLLQEELSDFGQAQVLLLQIEVDRDHLRGVVSLGELAHLIEVGVSN